MTALTLAPERIGVEATPEQIAAVERIDPAGFLSRDANGRDLLLAIITSEEVVVHTISPDGGSMKQTASLTRDGWIGLGPNPASSLPGFHR